MDTFLGIVVAVEGSRDYIACMHAYFSEDEKNKRIPTTTNKKNSRKEEVLFYFCKKAKGQ